MKIVDAIVVCFFCTILILSCSGNNTKAQQQTQKETVAGNTPSNIITKLHLKVPNSHFYIIPPKDFSVNKISGTIVKANGYAHFIVLKIISGRTRQALLSELKADCNRRHPGAWQQNEAIIDGHKAITYLYKMGKIYQRYLLFTDGHTNEMLIANYEESEAADGNDMFEALKTVVVMK
jgi:hypothetical protein